LARQFGVAWSSWRFTKRTERRPYMGEIRKRGRIWWIRYYRNGQRIEESSGFDKYDKARNS
jgi:hypothetical protein